jgi:hypothetical protein
MVELSISQMYVPLTPASPAREREQFENAGDCFIRVSPKPPLH